MKRLKCILIIILILTASAFFIPPAYCAEDTGKENAIYFNVPVSGDNSWENYDTIYCHIWQDGGDEFFTWQTTYEKCTRVKGNLWKYDLDNLDFSRGMQSGLIKGKNYAVIFSDNLGDQTYDLLFTTECIGDTVECTNTTKSNPVDPSVYCFVAKWRNNGDKYSSIEYTPEKTTTQPETESREEENDSLSFNMLLTVIIILSVVVAVLAVALVIKLIKR